MAEECKLKTLPTQILRSEDIVSIDSLLAETILEIQNTIDGSSFLNLLAEKFTKIVSATFDLLQTYNLTYSIDNIISKLTDILLLANDAGRDAKIIIIKSLAEKCMDLVQFQYFSLQHKLEILKTMNIVLQNCPGITKQELFINSILKTKLNQAIADLVEAGDYEYQVCIIEYFFRLAPKVLRADYTKNVTDNGTFYLELLNIRDNKFETDCRYFLNKQNAVCNKKSKRIYTIPAAYVKIDGTKVYKPSDEGYDEFWVDFNSGSKRIGIFCEPTFLSSQQSQDEGLWETISIWARDVNNYSYSVRNMLKTATIELLPGAQMIGNKRDEQSHLIVIAVSQDYDLQEALDSALKTKEDQSNQSKTENQIKLLTPISSLSVTSSLSKSKVSIPINPMITAQPVIESELNSNPNLIQMQKKANPKEYNRLPVKCSKAKEPVTRTASHINSVTANRLVVSDCRDHLKQSNISINKKALNSSKILRSGNKTKTPIVNLQHIKKKSLSTVNIPTDENESQSLKIFQGHEPFVKIKKDSFRGNGQFIINKQQEILTSQLVDSVENKMEEKIKKDDKKLLNTKLTEITLNKSTPCTNKNISIENSSLDDFKPSHISKKLIKKNEKKTVTTLTNLNSQSEKEKRHKRFSIKENNTPEVMHNLSPDCFTEKKKIETKNKAIQPKYIQSDNLRNESENVKSRENKNNLTIVESPVSCCISSLKSGDLYIEIVKQNKEELNDVVAETQSQSYQKLNTNDENTLLSFKSKCHVQSNNSSASYLVNNLTSVENSYIFSKTAVSKNNTNNSYNEKYKNALDINFKTVNDSAKCTQSCRNLRERRKNISYKEIDFINSSIVKKSKNKEAKKIKNKKAKLTDTVKVKKSFKSKKRNNHSSKHPDCHQNIESNNNKLSALASKKKFENDKLHQGIWTRHKIERTVTTLSFSGQLPKDNSSDPYDFDAECSVTGESILLPINTLRPLISSQKSLPKVTVKNENIKKRHKQDINLNKTDSKDIKSRNHHNIEKTRKSTLLNKAENNSFVTRSEKKCIYKSPVVSHIVKSHGSDSCSESSISPLLAFSKDVTQNPGLVFPHLDDSLPCTPYIEQKASPPKSLSFNLASIGSELSWTKQSSKDVKKRVNLKTYKTRHNKMTDKYCLQVPQKNPFTKKSILYDKENSSSLFNLEDESHEHADIMNKTPAAKFVSPLDITIGFNSGPSSAIRPPNAELKRAYSEISSNSNRDSDTDESSNDKLVGYPNFKPKKLFKTDLISSPTCKQNSFACLGSHFENVMMEEISGNEKEDIPKSKTSLDGFQKPSSNSKNVFKDNEIENFMKEKVSNNESKKSFYRFQMPLGKRKKLQKNKEMKSPEKKDCKLTAEEDFISNELDLSPSDSLNIAENESPSLELNYKSPRSHHINQLIQNKSQLSHTSEFSSPAVFHQNRILPSESCLKGIFAKKMNKKFPHIDEDLQNIMRTSCKFLHSSWESEQNKNLIAVEKCHELTQNIISHLNKDLQEFKSTEDSTMMLWTRVIDRLKKHRICQENQLKRLKLSHSLLKTSLLQSQEYRNSGQKNLQSALKQDMNALQKKIFAKINENSLKAVRQCLITSAMLS